MLPPEEFFSAEFLSAHGAGDSFPSGVIVCLEASAGAIHALPSPVAGADILAAYRTLFHRL